MMLNILLATTERIEETESTGVKELLDNFNDSIWGSMEGLFNVIDRRVRSGKPMIITTNLTIKEMDETEDLNEARIYDRIRAVCQPVQVKGESQRRASRSQMMEKFRGFFNVERKEGSLDDRD